MNNNPYALGQFETPPDVADLLLGLSVRRPSDRVLDPSCGQGILLERAAAWLNWLAPYPNPQIAETLVGIDMNPELVAAASYRVPEAQLTSANFLDQAAGNVEPFDAIICNPPYTSADVFGPLEEGSARQLALFAWEDSPAERPHAPLVPPSLAAALNGRLPLHAYFLVQSTEFLVEGGRLAFVLPNGWLDVAYGVELKQYLLDHYRVLAVVESAVERWFADAWINTCIILLEKCSNLDRRRGNLVHLARLKEPLSRLLPYSSASPHRFLAIERLVQRLLPGQSTVNEEADIHVREQQNLPAERKWGMALRAPMVFRHHRDHLNLAPLKTWAQVQRGYTTGANEFFYLTPETIAQWGIEPRFRRPLLKSLRAVNRLRLPASETNVQVLLIPRDSMLLGTAAAAYIDWGEEQGFHLRHTCAQRQPWYIFPEQAAAPLVLPKGIWHRHFAPLVAGDMAVDQQLYQIMIAPHLPLTAVAALLNSAWFALQLELRGRISFGRGLLWLAAYELEEVQLPDPRLLTRDQVARLEESFLALAGRPLGEGLEELAQPDRRALDEAVFDILGFSSRERDDVLHSLAERMMSRWQHAS